MDKKKEIIVFGAGKFFSDRKSALQEKNEIICILDNGTEDQYYLDNILVCNPKKINKFPKVPIIIMSDYVIDMMLQLGELLGEEECNHRVKVGRLYLPIFDEEHVLNKAEIKISINQGKMYALIEDDVKIHLDDNFGLFKKIYREYTKYKDILLQEMISMPLKPIDNSFGFRRGKPIDRYYIEKFLNDNKDDIKGDCLEIAENTYTLKYGEDRVKNSIILHVEGWGGNAIKGNLATGEGIENNSFDSMIITQTLMFIYDLKDTVNNIYRALKIGAHALITISGIAKISRYDDDNWGHYHSFYRRGLEKLFVPVFGENNVKITSYGNVKTAIMFLYGGTVEELKQEDFDYVDEDYPVIYGIWVQKE